MSRTHKDLKSHKKGFGKYHRDPQRKLTAFSHDVNKEVGESKVLEGKSDNDLSQDGFDKGEHWYGAKSVRGIRKNHRRERDYKTSAARTKLKQFDKQNLKNDETIQDSEED